MDLEFVPFDETKDYTIEIQIVEQMPKKIVSYAALFEQEKKAKEEKLMNEMKEKQKRKKNIKRRVYKAKNVRKNDKNQLTDNIVEKETTKILDTGDETDVEEEFSENSYFSDYEQEPSESSEIIEDKKISEAENSNLSVTENITADSLKLSYNSALPQSSTKTDCEDEKNIPNSKQVENTHIVFPTENESSHDVQKSFMIQSRHVENNEYRHCNCDVNVISQRPCVDEESRFPLNKLRSHS